MNPRNFLFIGALVLLAYLAGRYGAPVIMKSEIQMDVSRELVIQELTRQLVTKSLQMNSVTTTVQTPDGTIKTRTRTSSKENSIESVIEQHEAKERVIEKIVEKKVIERSRGVVVSALAGASLNHWGEGLKLGASVSKPLFGPVQIGAFAFTDLRMGVSLGLEF